MKHDPPVKTQGGVAAQTGRDAAHKQMIATFFVVQICLLLVLA